MEQQNKQTKKLRSIRYREVDLQVNIGKGRATKHGKAPQEAVSCLLAVEFGHRQDEPV